VHRRNKNQPFLDLRFFQRFLNFPRDVDELMLLLGVERKVFGVLFHGFSWRFFAV